MTCVQIKPQEEKAILQSPIVRNVSDNYLYLSTCKMSSTLTLTGLPSHGAEDSLGMLWCSQWAKRGPASLHLGTWGMNPLDQEAKHCPKGMSKSLIHCERKERAVTMQF